jgi:hypothetical protein
MRKWLQRRPPAAVDWCAVSGFASIRLPAVVLAAAVLASAGSAGAGGPTPTARPSIQGVLQQGAQLTAAPGTWAGSGGAIGYTYQWYRCDLNGAHCGSIHGATRATYKEVAADGGGTLGVTVNASDSGGVTATYAPLAGIIAAPSAALAPRAQPSLSGDPVVGQALTVGPATWTARAGTPSYRWLRCNSNGRLCATIAGARAAGYTVLAADAGHSLVAVISASKQSVWSTASGAVRATPGPVAAGRPPISGTLRQGEQLTGAAGPWSGSGAISYAYQWYRCDRNGAHCSAIHGATGPTYTQTARDVANTLALTVRATDPTGTTPAYSSLAGPVAPAAAVFAAAVQPSLAGTPVVGGTLKVSGGTFTATPASATYTWLRCNPNARLCSHVPGATTDTYVVTAADAGHALVASVRAAAAGNTRVVLTTAATVPG